MDMAVQLRALFSNRRKKLLAGSKVRELAERTWTEWEVVEAAAKKRGLTLNEYVHDTLITAARRDLAIAKHREHLKRGQKAPGVRGAADKRIAAAYARLAKGSEPITVTALKHAASANHRLVRQWVDDNQGKLEIPVVVQPAVQYGPRRHV